MVFGRRGGLLSAKISRLLEYETVPIGGQVESTGTTLKFFSDICLLLGSCRDLGWAIPSLCQNTFAAGAA